MESRDLPQTDRKLVRVIVGGSTLAVAGCLALLFGFHRSGGQIQYDFTMASVLAFLGGVVAMAWFWRRVFQLLQDEKRMWRFITITSVVFVIGFIACVFLPQFRPEGINESELLQGMILGFIAVAAVFFFVRVVMRLLEQADNQSSE